MIVTGSDHDLDIDTVSTGLLRQLVARNSAIVAPSLLGDTQHDCHLIDKEAVRDCDVCNQAIVRLVLRLLLLAIQVTDGASIGLLMRLNIERASLLETSLIFNELLVLQIKFSVQFSQ